jgi:uncharacterized protein YbbC (DUF1343 family)
MTLGELARMFNAERKIGVRLTVVPMQGYRREMWFDETGIAWVNPSPNLRSLNQAIFYPGVALAEASNVSVGRGTESPFELLGAPWIETEALAGYLRDRPIPAVEFEPVSFQPASNRFKGEICHGVRLILKDRDRLDAVRLGIEILCALQRLHPSRFEIDKALGLVGSRAVMQAIKDGQDPEAIAAAWQPQLDEFKKRREPYLLY